MAYDPPNGSYTSKVPPGTQAFREAIAEYFGFTRTEVVRDRNRCVQQRSEHCECRGIDFFTIVFEVGRPLFNWCVANNDLGIQSVIFFRRVWGFGTPRERAYTGPSPHTDHVHVGLTRQAAQSLTKAQIQARLGGEEEDEDVFALVTKDSGNVYLPVNGETAILLSADFSDGFVRVASGSAKIGWDISPKLSKNEDPQEREAHKVLGGRTVRVPLRQGAELVSLVHKGGQPVGARLVR